MAKKSTRSDEEDVFNTETPEEVADKNREARESFGKFMPYFSLKEDEQAVIRFLDEKPLTFYQHRVFDPDLKEGQGGHRNLTCMRTGCPLCAAGNKPRYVGAYRVIHVDHMENKKPVPTEKIFLKGINVVELLTRKAQKRPLTSANIEVERIGKGFDTKYTFDFTDDKKPIKDYKKPEDGDDLKAVFKLQPDVLERLAKTIKSGGKGRDDEGEDRPQRRRRDEEEEEERPSKSSRGRDRDEDSFF
jgi:hypothetical protein